MQIKNKLKDRLERFLNSYPTSEEQGGFLLARWGVISEFLPIPNVSPNPAARFESPSRATNLADKVARSRRMTIAAFWHYHPTPCIMSAADLSYAEVRRDIPFVTISPTADYGWKKEFIWYACLGIKPVKIQFI